MLSIIIFKVFISVFKELCLHIYLLVKANSYGP